MLPQNIEGFVQQWITDWNSHNLDNILSHYSQNVEIVTPMIQKSGINTTGTLKGLKAIREYWEKALHSFPDLTFELIDFTIGINCITIYYKSVLGMKAMETMWFDEKGKVKQMNASYRPLP